MNETRVLALSQPRHACHACGSCCYGHRIRLVDDAEAARIQGHALSLGVADPIEDGALRTVDGHCVFLGADKLCDIHRAFGGEQKPAVCQQYPLRFSVAEDGLRVGIDPGCTSVWKSWADGPAVHIATTMAPHDIHVSPSEIAAGKAIIAMAKTPEMSVARLAWLISGSGPNSDVQADNLPPGFDVRVIDRAKALRLDRFVADESLGEGIQRPLKHVVGGVLGLDRESPPPWAGTLPPEQTRFALEVIRNSIYMRLNDPELPVVGHALLLLAGVIVCGWADPSPASFGPALSTWARATRYRAFWQGFFPRPETISWFATGRT